MYISLTTILDRREANKDQGKGLVKADASWWCERMGSILIDPLLILSRTKWIDLDVLSPLITVGLEAMYMAA